jgi:hypothetical protein
VGLRVNSETYGSEEACLAGDGELGIGVRSLGEHSGVREDLVCISGDALSGSRGSYLEKLGSPSGTDSKHHEASCAS